MKKNKLDELEFANIDSEGLRKITSLENEINSKNGTDNIVLIGLKK